MENRLNNICLVQFARLSDVASYQESPSGAVSVDAAWQELLCAPGPSLLITDSLGKPGRLFESNFTCTMRVKAALENLYLIRLSFDDGHPPMIIGDPDLPVRFVQSHELKSKDLSFSHQSWHYPFREVLPAEP